MAAPFSLRAPADDDVDGIVALERESSREQGLDPTTQARDVIAEWGRPEFVRDRHERVAVADGRILGRAVVVTEGEIVQGFGYVAPDARGRGIGRALLRYIVETARDDRGATEVYTWADERRADALSLIEATPGAEQARTFYRMIDRAPATAPEPVLPSDVEIVTLDGDDLVDAVIEAHDNSFIDHWNFTPAERDEVVHELSLPSEDAALWFVARSRDGRIAGFNLCHLYPGETVVRGTIGPLGTTRPFRGIGLGRALLHHGRRALAARGATEVTLGVDSENPSGAVGFYLRNGFEILRTGRVYRIKL